MPRIETRLYVGVRGLSGQKAAARQSSMSTPRVSDPPDA